MHTEKIFSNYYCSYTQKILTITRNRTIEKERDNRKKKEERKKNERNEVHFLTFLSITEQ